MLIRPPDIVSADIFYQAFFLLLLSFFVSYSLSSLNGTQPYPATWSEVSVTENACPKSGISLPLETGGPKTTCLGRLRNSTANLTAYVLGTKHDRYKGVSALQTTRGLLDRLETT